MLVSAAAVALGDLFTARERMWIGAKVGVFARAPHGATTTGWVLFDWLRVGPEGR
jgi:hypothetical protein